ncbi:MAG: phenylacetate--CoA ligase, partial [Bacteroidota bacterium]
DHFFPEVVDKDTGQPLPYGEEGVLVLTTLTKEALPILRYWTNDICSINYDSNAKRTHIKMSAIKGRSDDMLIIRGVNLFYTQVEEVLQSVPGLSANYRLVVDKKGSMDQVLVEVEVNAGASSENESLAQALKHKIKDSIGITMDIALRPPASIPRSQGGKLSRILDKR